MKQKPFQASDKIVVFLSALIQQLCYTQGTPHRQHLILSLLRYSESELIVVAKNSARKIGKLTISK